MIKNISNFELLDNTSLIFMTYKNVIMVTVFLITAVNSAFTQFYGLSNYYTVRHTIGDSYLDDVSFLNPSSYPSSYNMINVGVKPGRFGMSELNSLHAFAVISIDSTWSLGLNISGIGGELYNEFSPEIGIRWNVNENINIGASGEFNKVTVKNYNSYNIPTFNLGGIVKLTNELNAGMYIRNLLRNYSGDIDKTVYQEGSFGLSYSADEDLTINADAVVVINSFNSFNVGIKYDFDENFTSRLAVSTNPGVVNLGVLCKVSDAFSFVLSMDYDITLGITPEIALIYRI